MIRACLCLTLVLCGLLQPAFADDPAPFAPADTSALPSSPLPGDTFRYGTPVEPAPPAPPQPAPGGSLYSTPGPAPQGPLPGYMPPAHQPRPATSYHSHPRYNPPHDHLPGRHYYFSGAETMPSANGFGPYDMGYGAFGGYGFPVYTGAFGGGFHPRFPYYSYRAPWYSPGPAGMNVNILW